MFDVSQITSKEANFVVKQNRICFCIFGQSWDWFRYSQNIIIVNNFIFNNIFYVYKVIIHNDIVYCYRLRSRLGIRFYYNIYNHSLHFCLIPYLVFV